MPMNVEEPTPAYLKGDAIDGIPIITVTGTPHTMGLHIGDRLKARIQVLVQERLGTLRRQSPELTDNPSEAVIHRDLARIREHG